MGYPTRESRRDSGYGHHVPLYSPKPEHPEHHVPSDDDSQAEDQPYSEDASPTAESPGYIADSDTIEDDTDADSIDYPDEPGTDDEDPEEDPSEKHDLEDEDPEEDPNEEHEPEDENAKEDESSEDSDKTEPFEENETAATPPPPRNRGARISAPLGHRAVMIRMRDDIPKEDMPPQRRFVLIAPLPECDIAESSAAVAARASRELLTEQRMLVMLEHGMMTSIKEVNLRVSYQAQIDVVRGQRTTYETKLHEVRQAYLSSEARNRVLLARLETLETHMSRMEWQRQRAEDDAVRQIMHTQVLEARARIDTVEDADSSC
ncbi:hypothetical protein Tco_1530023 [Tanacetum coccineum]